MAAGKRKCVRSPAKMTSCRDNLVLATGAKQSRDLLLTLPVAGSALLPRFADKLMLSGEVLAVGGVAEVSAVSFA